MTLDDVRVGQKISKKAEEYRKVTFGSLEAELREDEKVFYEGGVLAGTTCMALALQELAPEAYQALVDAIKATLDA